MTNFGKKTKQSSSSPPTTSLHEAEEKREESPSSISSAEEGKEMDSDYQNKDAEVTTTATNNHNTETAPTKYDERTMIWEAFYGFLFPKMAPIEWTTFVALSLFIAFPTAIYVVTFTKMGFGTQVYYFIAEYLSPIAFYLGIVLAVSAFVAYLFDIHYWTSENAVMGRNIFYVVFVIGVLTLGICLAGSYPYFPSAVFFIVLPIYLVFVRQLFYRNNTTKEFLYWVSGPLFVVAICTIIGWVVWTLIDIENEWNLGVLLNEAEASGCTAHFDEYPNCDSGGGKECFFFDPNLNRLDFGNCEDGEVCQLVYEDCYNPFIIWVGPFLVSLGLLALSFIASFLRGDGSPELEAKRFAKVWILLLFSMWVVASLSGAGAGASSTLMALIASLFIAAGIIINIAFNSNEKKERMQDILQLIMEKYGGLMNVFRGLLVVTCTPIFGLYLFISLIIQRIRTFAFKCYSTAPITTDSLRSVTGEGLFTIEGRRLIRMFQSWETTKIFTIAIYWGIAFMILYVIVAQYTILFLSWLIDITQDMNIVLVTVILLSVGMTMFLLPPISGVPIYLTLGIVIIPVARPSYGLVGAICYALLASLILKLLACTLQQKLIGGLLSGNVGVRKFCAINSNVMRSAKLVLKQPGLGIAKVCILIGCPDWPTSVLCGIMDLPLIPILVGTLPIVLLILPTLLTGSFMYMQDAKIEGTDELEFPWAGTMAAVFAVITAIVQFGSMVIAAYFIEKVIEEKKDELDAIPIDEEVRVLEEKTEQHKKAFDEITVWQTLPKEAQFTLCVSLSCMIICCYLVTLFPAACFRDYQLTYTIETHLDGNWTTLIKPLGNVANGLFAFSVLLFFGYRSWANRKATKKCEEAETAIYPENGDTNYELHKSYDQDDKQAKEVTDVEETK